jgi:TRAP-type mannitol/chloroaromatic compound transport system permease small subunit
MSRRYSLVLERQRHLKWRAFDPLEQMLMMLCGVALAGFATTVFFDVVTRSLGRPVLWIQEVTTTLFVYGIFIGTAAATRRNDHLYLSAISEALTGRARLIVERFTRLVMLGTALCMVPRAGRGLGEGQSCCQCFSKTSLATSAAVIAAGQPA